MPRVALFTLLAAALSVPVAAQRGAASFHGSLGRGPVHLGSQHAFSNRVSSRSAVRVPHGDSYGSLFLPYGDVFTDQQPEVEATADSPSFPGMIPPAAKPASQQAQLIEIPAAANSLATKVPPRTVFILNSGEQLEAQRFVLSASALSITADRRQRTVPLDVVDLNATINANRERGIDLRIPNDRNEISLSF